MPSSDPFVAALSRGWAAALDKERALSAYNRKENAMDYATLTLRVRVVGPDAVGEDAVTEQEEDQIGTAFSDAEEAAKKALAGMRFEVNADYD